MLGHVDKGRVRGWGPLQLGGHRGQESCPPTACAVVFLRFANSPSPNHPSPKPPHPTAPPHHRTTAPPHHRTTAPPHHRTTAPTPPHPHPPPRPPPQVPRRLGRQLGGRQGGGELSVQPDPKNPERACARPLLGRPKQKGMRKTLVLERLSFSMGRQPRKDKKTRTGSEKLQKGARRLFLADSLSDRRRNSFKPRPKQRRKQDTAQFSP